jgi:hypothetical protein
MSNMRSDPHRLLQALCAPNLPTDALRNNIPTKTSQWGSSGRIPDLYRGPCPSTRALTSTQFLGHFARFSFVQVELQTTAQDALDVMPAR